MDRSPLRSKRRRRRGYSLRPCTASPRSRPADHQPANAADPRSSPDGYARNQRTRVFFLGGVDRTGTHTAASVPGFSSAERDLRRRVFVYRVNIGGQKNLHAKRCPKAPISIRSDGWSKRICGASGRNHRGRAPPNLAVPACPAPGSGSGSGRVSAAMRTCRMSTMLFWVLVTVTFSPTSPSAVVRLKKLFPFPLIVLLNTCGVSGFPTGQPRSA